MKKISPQFWPTVTHTVRFDLKDFDLSNKVVFRFINPIWGWIIAAQSLHPKDLLWKPYKQKDRVSGARLYGGGVQYGKVFETSCKSCPIGGYVMAISLHWDGTNANGMYSTPIAVGVANINSQSAASHTCIGYMPTLTGMGRAFETTKKASEVKQYIRQQCIAAILRVLDEGARRGVRCTLPTVEGLKRVFRVFPKTGVSGVS